MTATTPHVPELSEGRPPSSALLERIRSSVIGRDEVLDGPYGRRRTTYADYTASGRGLTFIEDFIGEEVLRRYAKHPHRELRHRPADQPTA